MIAIELLEDTTTASMFVRVVYNGKVAKVPWDVCGPHGGNELGEWLCAYDGFAARVAAMVPTPEECAATAGVTTDIG